VGKEVTRLFNELSGYAIEKKFIRLLVAPRYLRIGLLKLIKQEIKNAESGKHAFVKLKLNSLVDEVIIDALYRASQAGVKVDVWVRGICSLMPGVEGLSENIIVRSVLGRYLEHSRVFVFANGGDPAVYIGSADMMHRNLDRRIEVLVKLSDPQHVSQVLDHVTRGVSDEVSSWHLASDGTWKRMAVAADGAPLVDIQDETMHRIARRQKTGSGV
jgi:polyphosphate kinase